MEKILNVAKYIVDTYKKISGTSIDEMKLHKLLYFTQRENLAITGQAMFQEPFEGWKYGPVSRAVRDAFTGTDIPIRIIEMTLREGLYLLSAKRMIPTLLHCRSREYHIGKILI